MKRFLSLWSRMLRITCAVGLLAWTMPVTAQEWGRSNQAADPFESQYFTNRYLANPAMAGMDSVLHLNMAYRKQYTDIQGAPVTAAFTADYNPGKRVGLGLIAYHDKAGLISRSRLALTYAYHLPVGDFGQKLHFGISAAFAHANLDTKGVVGDDTDPAIAEFNGRKNALEIDYGMGYTDHNITLQASLLNLVGFMKHFNETTGDVATFYASAAYAFHFNDIINSLEPQVSIRGVKQYNSIVDVGANLVMFHHLLNLFGLAHSSGSFSAGAGINYKNIFFIQGVYLTNTKGLRNYSDGNFEIDLTLFLFAKNKK